MKSLPNELLLNIFSRLNSKKDLYHISLVSKSWHSLSLQWIWQSVQVSDAQLPFFIRGLLLSAKRHIQEDICYSGYFPESSNSTGQTLNVVHEHEHLSFLQHINSLLPSVEDACLKAKEMVTITRDIHTSPNGVNAENTYITEDGQAPDIAPAAEPNLLNTHGALLSAIQQFVNRHNGMMQGGPDNIAIEQLEALMDRINAHVDVDEMDTLVVKPTKHVVKTFERKNLGWGKLVKVLKIPSDGKFVNLFGHVVLLLSGVKKLCLFHPPHDDKYIPALGPSLLLSCESIIQTAHSFIIEDLSKPVWHHVISSLSHYGQQLKHVTLEASGELEPFYSSSGILSILANSCPLLECLRLDSLSVGLDKNVETLVKKCNNLRAITLDYCYGITMQAFITLWNGLPRLEFIGFAGIIGPLPESFTLETRRSVETIRFVDCDVSDELFEHITPCAPNLKMIRIVFEDFSCAEIVEISNNISSRTLEAFRKYCNRLEIMAITRCPQLTGKDMGRLIGQGSVTVLDLHKSPEASLGQIDDDFLREIGPWLGKSRVQVLNLFGQSGLSFEVLLEGISCGWYEGISSLSLNYVPVQSAFLQALTETCTNLQALSIKNSPLVTQESISEFLNSIHERNQDKHRGEKKFQKVYALDQLLEGVPQGYQDIQDCWFGDEKLDILSLWEKAVWPL